MQTTTTTSDPYPFRRSADDPEPTLDRATTAFPAVSPSPRRWTIIDRSLPFARS